MKNIYTIDEAIYEAAQGCFSEVRKKGNEFSKAFGQACDVYRKRGLKADISKGRVTDNDGEILHFFSYDWQKVYEDTPHFIYWDFFSGVLNNCAYRIMRGDTPCT